MNPKSKFALFLSHATGDRRVAESLRSLICDALDIEEAAVFVSSDGESMRLGSKDEMQITEAHKSAKAIVALMTPRSIFRPWLLYETGGAHFQSAKPLFVVLSNGATVDCLPSPLKVWHAGYLTDRKCIYNLCGSLGKVFGKKSRELSEKLLQQLIKLADETSGNWELVNVGLVVDKASQSPFGFPNILDSAKPEGAKKYIYVFGQNLHFLTRGQTRYDFQHEIMSWLRGNRERRFKAVVSDIRCKAGVNAWQSIFRDDYKRHLSESCKILKRWMAQAKAEGLNLHVLVTDFVPATVVFVDPNENNGYMVLTPFTYKPIPGERPQFIIGNKQNKAVFNYYWGACYERIRDKCTVLR